MRIFVDMDDILVNLLSEWTFRLNKVSKYHNEPDDIIRWDMKIAYPDLPPNTLYAPLYWDEMWEDVKPVKDAYKYMKKLIEDGHEVYVATASTPHSLSVKTEHCLFKIFDFLTYKNVISIHNKSLLDGDILFDDYHENLRNFKGIKVLRDKPYNTNVDTPYVDFRVSTNNSWEEFYAIVEELQKLEEMCTIV